MTVSFPHLLTRVLSGIRDGRIRHATSQAARVARHMGRARGELGYTSSQSVGFAALSR